VVLLLGTEEDAQRNAVSCLEIGGTTGFILAPGCDLPYATPPQNLEAVARIVYEPYQRDVIKALGEKRSQMVALDMSEYGTVDKVIVDIITLDSESCAPCQYMVESVKAVVPEFEGLVEWREHKIKYRESLVFMTSLMVKNIPTICIDGRITFVSRIPPKEELIAAIQKRIFEKLRFKIRHKNGAVYILGKSEEECAEMCKSVQQAVNELGAAVSVTVVTDKAEIASYGVLRTPAVVVAKYQVKTEARVPPSEVIREWIKDVM
jgi:uroporphyrinogen decarboxylase